MNDQTRNWLTRLRENKGFTLIEMAIVLIIIGIIIGAVVKGKDIIRSGEQKKIYTKFINGWQSSYLSFYDRTGKILIIVDLIKISDPLRRPAPRSNKQRFPILDDP